MKKIVIVGGGIVGLATGLKLAERSPGSRIIVLEKEPNVGMHQSTHNSGVLHCGLYYKPGSLKARLAVDGIREMTRFAREHGIRHDICGKIVLATEESELGRLRDLHERGRQNGLQGLQWLNPEQIREREPAAAGVGALLVPEEGIIDFRGVIDRFAELLRAQGHEVRTGVCVNGLFTKGGKQMVLTTQGETEADYVVNCAGLYSDRVFEFTGEKPECKIVPFRGEYFKLKPSSRQLVRHLIYPVPNPKLPFLGVHFTRMIGGGAEAGPSAVLALRREGYRKTDFSLRDAWESITYPGLARFMMRFPGATIHELMNSCSTKSFLANLQRLVPSIQASDIEPGDAGVRAQAMNRRGELLMDFSFEERPGQLHVLNAPSPGATASLAIGAHVALKVAERLA
jgi:L-2-hydroxyglutarate oxidase